MPRQGTEHTVQQTQRWWQATNAESRQAYVTADKCHYFIPGFWFFRKLNFVFFDVELPVFEVFCIFLRGPAVESIRVLGCQTASVSLPSVHEPEVQHSMLPFVFFLWRFVFFCPATSKQTNQMLSSGERVKRKREKKRRKNKSQNYC